jgi:hypothetical protein
LQRGSNFQFYRVVPPEVMVISIGLGIRDYTPELVEEAIPTSGTGSRFEWRRD